MRAITATASRGDSMNTSLPGVPSSSSNSSRSIGVGLSPGDESYDEPYFYVRPWPCSGIPDLPPLEGEGKWHTEGWLGAVLPASHIQAKHSALSQVEQVRAFTKSAVPAARSLL